MTPFEYLLPFVSIIVGLAVADLAVSLHRLLRQRARVKWDWIPLLAALMVLLLVLQFWWGFYFFGRTEVWFRYGPFLLLTAVLVIMFLLASAALPDDVPNDGIDLRSYYTDNQRYFWTLFALFMMLSVAAQIVPASAAGTARPHGVATVLLMLLPNIIVAALLLTLAFVRSRTWHAVLVPALVALLVLLWSRLELG